MTDDLCFLHSYSNNQLSSLETTSTLVSTFAVNLRPHLVILIYNTLLKYFIKCVHSFIENIFQSNEQIRLYSAWRYLYENI